MAVTFASHGLVKAANCNNNDAIIPKDFERRQEVKTGIGLLIHKKKLGSRREGFWDRGKNEYHKSNKGRKQ